MDKVRVRQAARDHLSTVRDIELVAGQRYGEYGLDGVADDEPASVEELARYADDGRAWVAVDDAGQPIGYILVDIIDGGGHIEQVSVVPACQGHGVGRALIEQAEYWAISKGLPVLTLTTSTCLPHGGHERSCRSAVTLSASTARRRWPNLTRSWPDEETCCSPTSCSVTTSVATSHREPAESSTTG